MNLFSRNALSSLCECCPTPDSSRRRFVTGFPGRNTFLRHACELAAAAGARIQHLDVTLICEAPKIGPHREAMQQRIAVICALDPARVSVKATTTEQLGFTGRREGIAAQASASVEVPR